MAIPRVFVSSTCYDLRYVRENLKFFISNIGYQPVLSEEGGIYYDPNQYVQDACLAEVANCQMLILIIGGRFGSEYKDSAESIVNHEYREAVKNRIPVFAMVERQVHAEYLVYQKNKENKSLDASKIDYPGVDSTKIFSFMDEVQSNAVNNALVPFSDFNELESYLKQQWAGMIFSFLTRKSESERVASMLEALSAMSGKIEFLSKQILSSVGKDIEKLNVELYDIINKPQHQRVRTFLGDFTERMSSPLDVITKDELDGLCRRLGANVLELVDGRILLSNKYQTETLYSNTDEYAYIQKNYRAMRKELLDALEKGGLTPKSFIKEIEERKL